MEAGPAARATAAGSSDVPARTIGAPAEAPATERRLVSILFADLVGFTARSDGHDPEAVREFLSRYFDTARETVGRYGGVIEKFIGDAVMAVWGTPTAQEDDAERAVRAALDLVQAVRQLDAPGAESLELRAAVLTGEAAVTLGAAGQGMVAGDLVNTASRLQSVAPSGSVLVGESTLRAASRAILFEEAGDQVLRGKSAPVPAWRALRVVAERRGAGRSEGLEAPFVGRDDELRLLKEIYHGTVRERRSRLVSVTGQAGIGKSRLLWEFEKYLDGLVETVRWHQGRSPSYGEGITFWALGEMVRRRAGLAESDDQPTTRARIQATLLEFVPDEAERRWIEPALLFLLGVGEAPGGGRDELFAAWRTFFERIATNAPTILVFEDLHWADSGLLDFIDHLLDWSKAFPIFVVTLARPELIDRRPAWGAGRRNFVAISLEPLPEPAMRRLLAGMVPGLPEGAARAILARAGGVPLYAVETVRMLVTEGRLEVEGGAYRPVGDLSELHVPESLQALVAARLDALDPIERAILQDASVLGQTFALPALAAVTGRPEADLADQLRELVRREVVTLHADPRSPERGQYGFTQALIGEVAYGTLSKRDRRGRHLAAARYFEGVGDDELAGALATHYIAAYQASPAGPEAEAVAVQARLALRGAAERAAALGSHEQAVAYLRQALRVTTDRVEEADLLERAGASSSAAAHHEDAQAFLRAAIELRRALSDRPALARATAALADSFLAAFRAAAALEVLEPAVGQFDDLRDDPNVVGLYGQLARAYFYLEDLPRAQAIAEEVLSVAERLDLLPIVADTLVTRGMGLAMVGRAYEGIGALEAGLRLADAHGLLNAILRAHINISGITWMRDPRDALASARAGVELARRFGRRSSEVVLLSNAAYAATRTGDWDWVIGELRAALPVELETGDRAVVLQGLIPLLVYRGEDVGDLLGELDALLESDNDPQNQADLRRARAARALAEGRYVEAFVQSVEAGSLSAVNGPAPFAVAGRAALWAADAERLAEALGRHVATGQHGPAIELERVTMRAGAAALAGQAAAAAVLYLDALHGWRELGCRWDLALTVIDAVVAGAGTATGLDDETAEARAILQELGAAPFLARLDGPADQPGTARQATPGHVADRGERAGSSRRAPTAWDGARPAASEAALGPAAKPGESVVRAS